MMLLTALRSAHAATWAVTVDPLTAALGYAHVQVERRLSPSASLYLGPHLRLYDSLLDDTVEPYTGLGVESGARWYPRADALAGLWLGGRGVIARLKTDDGLTAPGGYISALAGRTWILGEHFVLSGGAGGQYIHYTIDGLGVQGFFPALHTVLGVAW